MKRGWILLAMLAAVLAPVAVRAQVSVYGEFSMTRLHNLTSQDNLFGVTTGLLVDGPKIAHTPLTAGADLQGRFVGKSGEKLNGITVGPRIALPLHSGSITPYAEFMIGFARYNNPNNGGATTDSTIQFNGGVAKKMTPHVDLAAEYSYAQYYALGGEYNPKTFSAGVIYHLRAR